MKKDIRQDILLRNNATNIHYTIFINYHDINSIIIVATCLFNEYQIILSRIRDVT